MKTSFLHENNQINLQKKKNLKAMQVTATRRCRFKTLFMTVLYSLIYDRIRGPDKKSIITEISLTQCCPTFYAEW